MSGRNEAGAFLGKGWKFPPKVKEATGRMEVVREEEDIAEAIKVILFTRKGERIMRPDFGCGMQKFVFAEMNFGTLREMEREITDAIIAWEPRVIEPEAQVSLEGLSDGYVTIHIRYVVRTTNNPYNLVFPYFIQEGQ